MFQKIRKSLFGKPDAPSRADPTTVPGEKQQPAVVTNNPDSSNTSSSLGHSHPVVANEAPARSKTYPVILSEQEIAARPDETFPHDDTTKETVSRGEVTWKTLFTSTHTPTDSLSTGIAVCPPKTGHLCAHRHAQAEVYYIIQGRGTVKIDGKETAVQAGSVVFIPGDAEHAIWNSDEEPLQWFYVFPTDAFENVIYRFS